MKLPRSIQGRLLVLMLGLVTAVWVGTAVATWVDVRHELDELLDSHLAQGAALLVAQQKLEMESDDPSDDDEGGDRGERRLDAPTLHRYAPKVAFQVFHEGRLSVRSAEAPAEPMSPLASGFDTREIGGTRWRIFAAQGAEHDVQVYVGEQIESRGAILWAVLRSTFWPMALSLPLLALAVWWSVREGIRPLNRLGQALAARQPQDLAPIQMDDAPMEMQPLLHSLHGLFERIAGLLASERRFTADAAHELRTPIAGIRLQAQVALGATDEADRRHALQATLQGCDRATRLVDQMLTLARLESQESAIQTTVDLAAVTRRVVADVAVRALDKQQTLTLDADTACLVQGEETLLGVLVRNLVDNAIRYSPAGAQIHVKLTHAPAGHAALQVDDSGPGLTDSEQQRLGERFFRVLGHTEPGSGLGWSIVRRIASVHGATVVVSRSDTLGGLRVSVSWPTLR